MPLVNSEIRKTSSNFLSNLVQFLMVNRCLLTFASLGVCYLLYHFFFIVHTDAFLRCFPGHETYQLVVTFMYVHASERASLRVRFSPWMRFTN